MRQVKPAVYSGPGGWGWVKLEELARICGMPPASLVEVYFYLADDPEGGVLPIALAEDYPEGATSADLPRHIDRVGRERPGLGWGDEHDRTDRLRTGNLFVPVGWALAVLDTIDTQTPGHVGIG